MLATKFSPSQIKKDSHLVDFDQNWLSELNSEEAASIVGGFTIVNNSDKTRRFYNFGESVVPQSQTLQPAEKGTYEGEYILYNTSANGFEPAVAKVDPTETIRFLQEGNMISVDTNSKVSPSSPC